MITITHKGGVGVNSWYAIHRDGVPLGTIQRNGMTSCMIRSDHYSETLGRYANVARAKEAAETLYFPTEHEVYETICGRVEAKRRAWLEGERNHEIMQAMYDLANGSNSAQERLIELAREIDAFAKDRSEVYAKVRARADANKTYIGSEPTYPDPPAAKAA